MDKEGQLEQLKGVAGCYIIGTKHGYQDLSKHNGHQDDKVLYYGDEPIKFPYPKGLSPVFYVGQAEDLHKRINRHINLFNKTSEGNTENEPRALWSYACEFGYKIAFFECDDHVQMEKKVLMSFHHKFGAIPICNGQWPGRKEG